MLTFLAPKQDFKFLEINKLVFFIFDSLEPDTLSNGG